jgi:hypothetical protein
MSLVLLRLVVLVVLAAEVMAHGIRPAAQLLVRLTQAAVAVAVLTTHNQRVQVVQAS